MTRLKISHKRKSQYAALGIVALFALQPLSGIPLARADKFDEQIKALERQITLEDSKKSDVGEQAAEQKQTVDGLLEQLSMLKASIAQTANRKQATETELETLQKDLADKKEQLSEQFKILYMEEQSLTPLEMIASSKNLSDYMDQQEYRERIKDQVATNITAVEKKQEELDTKNKEVVALLEQQTQQEQAVATQKQTAHAELGVSETQLNSLEGSISQKTTEVVALREQQEVANSALLAAPAPSVPAPIATAPSSGGSTPTTPTPSYPSGTYPTRPGMLVVYGNGVSGGGYPAPWATQPLDAMVDTWGMYSRECVSYTAFKVAQSGRNMPKWGRTGPANARNWPSRAASSGIAYDGNPRVGDVAISMAGYYGHAMYVEDVYPNGLIKVSQYNYYVRGEYSEMVISSSNLYFIHF